MIDKFRLPTNEELDAANAKGIPNTVIRCRINNYGWDTDRALTTPLNEHLKYTEEQVSQMKASSVDRRTILGRLRRGWDFERALTEPPQNIGRGARLNGHATKVR